MAPAVRASRRQAQSAQPTISFNRISKPSVTAKASSKSLACKQLALDKACDNQVLIPVTTTPCKYSKRAPTSITVTPKTSRGAQRSASRQCKEEDSQRQLVFPVTPVKKRKRTDDLSDSEEKEEEVQFFSSSKKARITLPTPRPSPTRKNELSEDFRRARCGNSPGPIPEPIQELFAIHKYFVRAFSLHRSHNGTSADANIHAILDSVTRLYQKRTVTVIDIQRMLALYEIQEKNDVSPNAQFSHNESPFKLTVIGSGSGKREVVAYIGFTDERKFCKEIGFNEHDLITSYDVMMELTCRNNKKCKESYIQGSVEGYPLLKFEVGAQTIARQAKTTEKRNYILGGRKTDLDVGKLSIKDEDEENIPPQKELTVKSRTLSLFDRVKAKQLANASVSAPSAEAVRRKHALGRVAEIVEILRMKQQQRLGAYRGAGNNGKASFSFYQIVGEIKASMNIPMADDEIKLCLEIMSKEVEGGWLKVYELGATKSVVLTGTGVSGTQVAKALKVC